MKIGKSEAMKIDTIQRIYESNQGFSWWILILQDSTCKGVNRINDSHMKIELNQRTVIRFIQENHKRT